MCFSEPDAAFFVGLPDLLFIGPDDFRGEQVGELESGFVVDELVFADLLDVGGEGAGKEVVGAGLAAGAFGPGGVDIPGLLVFVLLGNVTAVFDVCKSEFAALDEGGSNLVREHFQIDVFGRAVAHFPDDDDGLLGLSGDVFGGRHQRVDHPFGDELHVVFAEAVVQQGDGLRIFVGPFCKGPGACAPDGERKGYDPDCVFHCVFLLSMR